MKNLSNFKIIIKTREYLIQAIYQMLFSNDDIQKIISQFKEEHKDKKVDFNVFADSLKSIDKNNIFVNSVWQARVLTHHLRAYIPISVGVHFGSRA